MSGLMFLGLIFWAFHVVHHVHVVHVVHVFLDPKFPRWPFLCRNLTRKARDGPGWQMLRGCDAPRPLVPGRLYDIFPQTDIFFTKKHTNTKTYQLPQALF